MQEERKTRMPRYVWRIEIAVAAAALALTFGVGVLGGVASVERARFLAAAGTSVSGTMPKSCGEAQAKAAATQGKTDPPASGAFVLGKSGTAFDKCYGAVLKPEAEQKKKKDPAYIYKPTDYKCVGRTYTAHVSTEGVKVEGSITDPSQGEGKCGKAKVVAKDPNKPDAKPEQKDAQAGKGGEGMKMPELPKPPEKGKGGGGAGQPQQSQGCTEVDKSRCPASQLLGSTLPEVAAQAPSAPDTVSRLEEIAQAPVPAVFVSQRADGLPYPEPASYAPEGDTVRIDVVSEGKAAAPSQDSASLGAPASVQTTGFSGGEAAPAAPENKGALQGLLSRLSQAVSSLLSWLPF